MFLYLNFHMDRHIAFVLVFSYNVESKLAEGLNISKSQLLFGLSDE